MFLVQKAADVMETDVPIVPAETKLDEFLLRPENKGEIRHVVVTRDNRISGVLRINTGIRQHLSNAGTGVTLGDVARRDFTIVHERDVVFDIIARMSRRGAVMALVVNTLSNRAIPRPSDIRGVISKEHVADSVAESVSIYPQ
jgi:CIC family chloride channel protein